MREMSPSRQKMLIAKNFAKELHMRIGDNLKAVFAVGSVAAGMAAPESDIDLVVIHDNFEVANFKVLEKCWFFEYSFNKKVKEGLVAKFAHKDYFESYGKNKSIEEGAMKYLFDGAIPVFGKKYVLEHKNCWRYPHLETIRKRYILPGKGTPKTVPKERIAFKRNRGRFAVP